jgi:hypothetical protein
LSVVTHLTDKNVSDYPAWAVDNCGNGSVFVGGGPDGRGMKNAIVSPPAFSPERQDLFRPMRADPSGARGPTPRAVRGTSYRRTSQGLYLPAYVSDADPEQRIVEAAAVLPEFGGVTGWATLRWCGARWIDGHGPDGRQPVSLATGYSDIRSQLGIDVSQERLGPGDLLTWDGLPIVSPVRALYFAMRYAANVRRAVRLVDMTAFADIVSLLEITSYVHAHPGWTGAPQAREALTLADENAWSPMEVDTRLCWLVDAGLPPVLTNRPLFDRAGRHLATPDLIEVDAGVVVEYNGAVHLDPVLRRLDVSREDLYRSLGLEVVVAVAGQSRSELARMMRAAHARARFERERERTWTITPPPWWTPTLTVQQRRALEPELRRRLLRHRDLAA